MREVIKEGRDVNEAIDLACAQLGVERGQASFEIIELPKTSLFGLRKKPAKVRVYVEEPEAPKKKAPLPKKEAPRAAASKPEPPKEPKKETRQKQFVPPEVVEPKQRPETPAPVKEAEKPRINAVQERPEAAAAPEAPQENARFIAMEETEGKAKAACEYVKAVLLEMGVDAKITVAQNDNGVIIRLSGDGLGVVIGRRGETLDALQYLTGLVANRCEGDYLRVTIDTGNYREKRERTLQQLARKLSASALRSGRSSMLEPMNPYERRIIHSTVSQIEGVTSSSIGEEPNRRVVISPVNAKPRPPRRPQGTQGGGPRRTSPGGRRPPRYNNHNEGGEFRERPPRRENMDRPRGEEAHPISTAVDREYAKELERQPAFAKPEQPAQPEARERVPREKPKDEAGDLPLYGKIDL